MKKTLQFILAFVIGLGMFIIPNNIAKAEEKSGSIFDNRIKIATTTNLGWYNFFTDFKFKDMGDGSARLKVFYDGKLLEPSQINPSITLTVPITIKLRDNNGTPYYQEIFGPQNTLRHMATQLGNQRLRYGLDSIQIIPVYEEVTLGTTQAAITGPIHSNLENLNFATILRKSQGEKYQFRVERDGLYAEYRNQVRIPDGEYIIETAENPNRVLDILDGYDIKTANFDKSKNNQKFRLEYNNKNKAYKIITTDNKLLSRQNRTDNNVIIYPDENHNDQFWYLENADNGRHRLVSARNTVQVLNLDANNINISVNGRNSSSLKQQFTFVKSTDKTEVEIIEGEWKIASALDHNTLVDADKYSHNVTLYYRHITAINQTWSFVYNPDKKAYVIRNKANNRALAWDSNKGNNVITFPYGGYSDQYWILEKGSDGYYMFKNYKNPNMVLDLYGGQTSNGTNIQVYERNNGNNQKFKLVKE